ncbi:MAG TPA: hypothetical protein VGY77_10530, partial [Gemmataceae bacterium]|nr:hypothetical protein [Gemmataceae bacterium]
PVFARSMAFGFFEGSSLYGIFCFYLPSSIVIAPTLMITFSALSSASGVFFPIDSRDTTIQFP